MSNELALSTIGMSAYNYLAKSGVVMPKPTLKSMISSQLRYTITQSVFDAAIAALLARGYIRNVDVGAGTVDVVDTQRRIVRWRSHSGDGWNGWTIMGSTGPITLQEAIQ